MSRVEAPSYTLSSQCELTPSASGGFSTGGRQRLLADIGRRLHDLHAASLSDLQASMLEPVDGAPEALQVVVGQLRQLTRLYERVPKHVDWSKMQEAAVLSVPGEITALGLFSDGSLMVARSGGRTHSVLRLDFRTGEEFSGTPVQEHAMHVVGVTQSDAVMIRRYSDANATYPYVRPLELWNPYTGSYTLVRSSEPNPALYDPYTDRIFVTCDLHDYRKMEVFDGASGEKIDTWDMATSVLPRSFRPAGFTSQGHIVMHNDRQIVVIDPVRKNTVQVKAISTADCVACAVLPDDSIAYVQSAGDIGSSLNIWQPTDNTSQLMFSGSQTLDPEIDTLCVVPCPLNPEVLIELHAFHVWSKPTLVARNRNTGELIWNPSMEFDVRPQAPSYLAVSYENTIFVGYGSHLYVFAEEKV